ncbi:DUF2332 domain-containing protein [Longimicrobium sp.]|uniref:DUF2332 domain-containing protein n=1 Tax=Longimicrobium sp. TaxID=2029185 RepID=UPI003B3B0AE9
MDQKDAHTQLRARYRQFAHNEAKGVSPLYEALARAVAESEAMLAFIASLPGPKQQPNLVFAAVRHLYGTPRDEGHLDALIAEHAEAIRAVVMARATQTNEPGRCAVVLPVFARLPQPLALLEVGASAGLCLLPDLYAYDYGRARLEPEIDVGYPAPVFPCRANDATPLPERMPPIAWRGGLELNPVNVFNTDDTAWLQTLVWPGQEARAERLHAAIHIARRYSGDVIRGDLTREQDLRIHASRAPQNATLVIFHSAVLNYVHPRERERFVQTVRDLGAVWISNEGPGVFPEIAVKLDGPPPSDRFILAVNGEPVAFTGGHGQSIDWIAASPDPLAGSLA